MARLPLLFVVLGLAACGGSGSGKQQAEPRCPTKGAKVSFPLLDRAKDYTVRVRTNLGAFAVALDAKDSPCTPSDARYARGVVAMAKTALEPPGTAGSQFFVVTGADAGLAPDYALLGKVTKGLAVVERIGRLGDATEHPTRKVTVLHMTVSP